jgi:hypothetical protein
LLECWQAFTLKCFRLHTLQYLIPIGTWQTKVPMLIDVFFTLS